MISVATLVAATPFPSLESTALRAPAAAGFVSAVFGSHMVLQRSPAQPRVWGNTTPGARVATWLTSHNSSASFSTVAAADGTWVQQLPPTPGSTTAYNLSFASSTGENATLVDVVFGEVYICGGQSNMEYAVPAVTDSDAVAREANAYPQIRFFSVGHRTSSPTPLRDLATVWEPWQVASNTSIRKDFGPHSHLFATFSAVCWFFGKRIAEGLAAAEERVVPVGLISANWGGTKVEVWTPPEAYAKCGRAVESSDMYNAIIHPYTIGPLSLAGFAWYQAEANTDPTAPETSAANYSCLFPRMIDSWRARFAARAAYFGFIQLSTWCIDPTTGSTDALPRMREAQMAAAALPHVGWATNADVGYGCNIHPPTKQIVGARLGDSALAVAHGLNVSWRSPRYVSAQQLAAGGAAGAQASVRLAVSLSDVGAGGLTLRPPRNAVLSGGAGVLQNWTLDCAAPLNGSAWNAAGNCAWAALLVPSLGWLNATVTTDGAGAGLVLTAALPAGVGAANATVAASAYGYGPIPLMTAYDLRTGLPVLPWNRSV